jgi:hypothetical protein
MRKLKVLLGGIFFKNFTGSEMYLYELSKNLVKLECDVSIFSPNLGDPLMSMVSKLGVKTYNVGNLPKQEIFDIIHVQHKPIVNELIRIFPNIPKICTIHSEVLEIEEPIIHESIKKYISIRNEIYDFLSNDFKIDNNKLVTIFNPIDETKFNTNNISNGNYTLFVGSFENLRRNTIFDLAHYTKEQNKELWLVGKNHSDYLPIVLKEKHVRHFDATWNVESYIKDCKDTAGILLGRTTIEGWMCGKPGWIYDIDRNGNIRDKNLFDPPLDLEKFKSMNVAFKIKKEYLKLIT